MLRGEEKLLRYKRPTEVRKGISKQFEEGNHAAVIRKVTRLPGDKKKKTDSFMFHIVGTNGESGVGFLSFGNSFTETNLQYLLASIEDNGVSIPDVSFGYNRATYEFLFGKKVFIKVEEGLYKGRKTPKITGFITKAEYEQEEF